MAKKDNGPDTDADLAGAADAASSSDSAETPSIVVGQNRAKRLDETVPGGRYTRADGTVVNAHGRPIE